MLKAFIADVQALTKNQQKRLFVKEPHFDKKWANNSNADKNFNREDYDLKVRDQNAEIHDQILVMYKTAGINPKRNKFLNRIAVQSLDFIQEQRNQLLKAKQEEELCHNSMANMMEHLFEILKSFAYELNNTLGYGPLHVATTKPQAVTETTKFNALRQAEETITYYRGRLSTPSFSLVLRGDRKGIQFYLMPVSRALGLSSQEKHFIPIETLSTNFSDGLVVWQTEDGYPLTPSRVESMCMNLFEKLIEETKIQVLSDADENAGAAEAS